MLLDHHVIDAIFGLYLDIIVVLVFIVLLAIKQKNEAEDQRREERGEPSRKESQ